MAIPATKPSGLRARLARHASSPEQVWVLDIPFELRAWASSQGVGWDASLRASVWRGPALPESLAPFAPNPFSWEWRKMGQANPGLALAPEALKPAWSARPHQREASLAMQRCWKAGFSGFLLADAVGLGKTISAWDFLLGERKLKKILIVTTVSALAHWRNTILRVGWGDKEILVINYDRLEKLFDVEGKDLSTRKKGKKKRIAGKGTPEIFDAIIFDEAHKGKNLGSARSLMMRRLKDKAKFTIWATATAGQNPLEMAYLAPLLAEVTGSRLSALTADFEQWCLDQDIGVSRGKFGRWEWRKSRAALEKVHAWLFSGSPAPGIRRLPTQIAGWQALERSLSPQALGPEGRRQYQLAWKAFQAERAGAKPGGSARKKPSENGLVAQLRFRQKSSLLRVDSTLGLVADLLDNERSVAVSVAFHETLEALAKELRASGIDPAVIHGKLSAREKEAQRLRFQKDETPVVLFTVEEAISLHQAEFGGRPRTQLVHDLRWSAIQMEQIDGRCHRDGSFAPSLWLYAEQSIEEEIASVLLDRVIAMKTMHGDDTSDMEAIEAILLRHQEAARAA